MNEKLNLTDQARRELAVEVLYTSLKKNHPTITKDECYEIYDQMQAEIRNERSQSAEMDAG